jgi:DNA-binding NarL/FixJ family response regulator
MSYFRFPDIELLNQGNVFTEREFEIIKYIATGLDSKDIAGKLFISQNTVNTHRRNILKKTHKANISELILELKDQGVL